jgi:hypothetical protein
VTRGLSAETPMLCSLAGRGKPVVQSRLAVCELCEREVWLPVNVFGVERIWCWECAGPEIERMEKAGEPPLFGPSTQKLAGIIRRELAM